MRSLLHGLLESAADETPDNVALVDRDRSFTYRELDEWANQTAGRLIEAGVRPGDRVGIFLDKSAEAVAGIYGALKAGAAYVPLDARAPATRLAYIAQDCGIRLLISESRQAARCQELAGEGAPCRHVLIMDRSSTEEPAGDLELLPGARVEGAHPRPQVRRIDDDLAYILYTSGSTGSPKGVMLSHRNGLAFVEWAARTVALSPQDRLSSHAPLHFDLSIFDLFGAALAGASVHLVPHGTSVFPVEVAKFIDSQQITVWYSVPSILSLLTQHGNLSPASLPSLRTVVFAGEVFPTKYLAELMRLVPHADFHNWYGPTETNVCTAYRVPGPPDVADGDIPIGSAIDNVETFVLAVDGSPVQPGERGELFVRGATVMLGYWGDLDKTRSRLVPDPLSRADHHRSYATGDIVTELPTGDYRFLGRRDHQIKSRGYRIELGEIETALNAHPRVRQCVVVAVPDEVVSNRIWAYVVVDGDQDDKNTLSTWCSSRIPKYMIPEHFVFAEELPKTSTGKIDRQAILASAMT